VGISNDSSWRSVASQFAHDLNQFVASQHFGCRRAKSDASVSFLGRGAWLGLEFDIHRLPGFPGDGFEIGSGYFVESGTGLDAPVFELPLLRDDIPHSAAARFAKCDCDRSHRRLAPLSMDVPAYISALPQQKQVAACLIGSQRAHQPDTDDHLESIFFSGGLIVLCRQFQFPGFGDCL
jgi:hypothetical protein